MAKAHALILTTLAAVIGVCGLLHPVQGEAGRGYIHAIPASVVIKTAQRHGWAFRASGPEPGSCHWHDNTLSVDPAARCQLELFIPPSSRCQWLKPGWHIRDIKFSRQDFTWLQPPGKDRPTARLVFETHAYSLIIKAEQIIFESLSANSIDIARVFSHCES